MKRSPALTSTPQRFRCLALTLILGAGGLALTPLSADEDRERSPGGDSRPGQEAFEDRVHQLRARIHELAEAGRREEAVRLERELREMIDRHEKEVRHIEGRPERGESADSHRRRPSHPGEELERRLHHLHAAAENLEQAGLPDQAHAIRKHAEELEREFHERRRPEEHPGEMIEALHAEIAELGEIVRDLREHIEALEEAFEEELEELRDEIEENDDDDDD